MDTLNKILRLIEQTYPTDAAFEDALGVSRKTVDSWKRGKSESYLKRIPEISRLFGVSADFLLGGAADEGDSAGERQEAVPEEFVLMARKLYDISEGQRQRIYRILNSTIDNVLEALKDESSD